ncbi:universal stress protein [Cytophagales bacterium LB-30]|uniref:Universal stress protein n=1 Tax=Shiella aurantiaca TaxID=3058365 RepID=A0ABT8F1D1_9BACT|nr:universal stress protein [Shiella aurantiaca]MDN4164210.1 universal stress protein [Shiella aurantiaca]
MNSFKRVLVGLDFSPMDQVLMQFIHEHAHDLGVEKVYYFHCSKSLELPEAIKKSYPELLAPLDEVIKKNIEELVKEHHNEAIEHETVVIEGTPLTELLKYLKIKETDLLIMGKKNLADGSGSLAKSIARKAPNSVLLVPENQYRTIDTILCPIDFSQHAQLTLQTAHALKSSTHASVEVFYIYEVPFGYSKLGKTREEFSAILAANAEKDFQILCKQIGHKTSDFTFVCREKDDTMSLAQMIQQEADSSHADLVMIGSKGRTNASAVLLGSLAEALSQAETKVPLLIFKKKGENLGFLEALFEL